jgi:hypothetical protein
MSIRPTHCWEVICDKCAKGTINAFGEDDIDVHDYIRKNGWMCEYKYGAELHYCTKCAEKLN